MPEIFFNCKTVQTNAMRILFESLKNIISDVNLNVDTRGIKLTTIDGTNNAIINLFLDSVKFEEYSCKNNLNIGLNLLSVFKIIKGVKNNDTLSLTVYDDLSYLYISSTNSDKKLRNTSKIKILDMDEKIYNIPDICYSSFITMPATDFQSYISELSNISNIIKMETSDNKLKLSAKGDFADQEITINEMNSNNAQEFNEASFNIKFIQLFTKSTNLCSTVEIYIKSGFPLTLIYNVANLGQLKYCLAPNS